MTAYDYDHQKRREALLPLAYNTPCALCRELMLRGQELDLDHSTPLMVDRRSKGDRIVHASCNRRAGAKMRTHRSRYRPSRSW